jgi:hypothetical protein
MTKYVVKLTTKNEANIIVEADGDKEAFHKAEDKYYELMVKDLKLKEHHADVSRINAEIGDE